MRAYEGEPSALGVVEQFTRACAELPFFRERASAMLTRAEFAERVDAIESTLACMEDTLKTVRTSAEAGALRAILADGLRLYRIVNDEPTARGFRLSALRRFEGYVSADKRTNLLQVLARRLTDKDALADLSRLTGSLSSIGRVVWSDVAYEAEALSRTVADLSALLERIEMSDAASASATGVGELPGRLANFVLDCADFCNGTASPVAERVQRRHQQVEAATRELLQYLAVEEKAWARPEEALATLLEVLLALQQAKRYQALAAERAARAAGAAGSGGPGGVAGDGAAGEGTRGAGETVLLVDGVADRFAHGPTIDDHSGSERSAELLRLLLRRASLTAPRAGEDDEDSDAEEEDDLWY